jgi:hypothetical protein
LQSAYSKRFARHARIFAMRMVQHEPVLYLYPLVGIVLVAAGEAVMRRRAWGELTRGNALLMVTWGAVGLAIGGAVVFAGWCFTCRLPVEIPLGIAVGAAGVPVMRGWARGVAGVLVLAVAAAFMMHV